MKISIITPSFNSDKYIKHTIESILSQTYHHIEHIIIDGGSTDNTLNIIDQYKKEMIKVVSEPDAGLYDAINKGLKLASGDIIGILNSDDFLANNEIIQLVVNSFLLNNIDGLYGDVQMIKNDRPYRKYSSKTFKKSKLKFGIMPAHPTLYLKREVIANIGFYDLSYRIASDFDYIVRLFQNDSLKFLYTNNVMVTMRAGGLSTSGFKSNELISKEARKILRTNKIYTNYFLIRLRYLMKLKQLF